MDFIVVGGIAAAIYGAIRETTDLDISCSTEPANLDRLARTLTGIGARVRGSTRPARMIQADLLLGANFMTFETRLGELDILLSPIAGMRYDELASRSHAVQVGDRLIAIASKEDLIRMKSEAGRPKDIEVIDELEALDELGNNGLADDPPAPQLDWTLEP